MKFIIKDLRLFASLFLRLQNWHTIGPLIIFLIPEDSKFSNADLNLASQPLLNCFTGR